MKKKLFQEVINKIAHLGFENKVRGNCIWRNTNLGKVAVQLCFVDNFDDFEIKLIFAVRVEEVERLKNDFFNFTKRKGVNETATISVEYGFVPYRNYKWWTISDEKDIEVVSKEISNKIETSGEQYFNQYSDLESIFQLVLSNDESTFMYRPSGNLDAIIAVSLALIMGKPNIQEIIKLKEEHLKGYNTTFYFENFQEFLFMLKNKNILN